MDKVKKISIVTLTYNNWRVLGVAIRSVLGQKVSKEYQIEYLVVDDGTLDFDLTAVEKYFSTTDIDYKIIVNKENIGAVASFNNAVRMSTGDIIVVLSADDEFYDESVVNDIADQFSNTESLIITALRVPVVGGVEQSPLPSKSDISLFPDVNKLLKRLMVGGNIISGASTYYRKSIFNKVGLFDTDYFLLEDYPFYIRVLSIGIKIDLMNRISIKYGVEGVSSPKKLHPLLKKDLDLLCKRILTRDDLTAFEKRKVKFSFLPKREKIRNSLIYPDLILLWSIKRIIKIVSFE